MGYTTGMKVNEEFLKSHPEFKCEAEVAPIKVDKWFEERINNWDFMNDNCLKKFNVELIVTKDVKSLYE